MQSLTEVAKNLQQILAPGDIAHIAIQMLGCINKEITAHTIRTSFIAMSIAEAYPFKEGGSIQNLVLLSMLHTVGFFREDAVFGYNPHESDIDYFTDEKSVLSKYVFSSLYLKYMTPIRTDAEALEDFTRPFNPNQTAYTYLDDYRSIIYFSARISHFISKFPDELLPEDLNELAPGYFNPLVVDTFNQVNHGDIILEQLITGTYRASLSQFMFQVQYSEEETKQLEKLLIYFLDFKSTHTMKHAINTACYALSIGHRINLSLTELSKLYTSAALHDIGKIATPQRILEFPGKLSPEDMGIMRHHVNHSRRILTGFVPFDILENVYRHHEKLNGKGYPKQVPGDQLTLLQRLLTVADITSALNDSRSYKEEFSKEKVISIMTSMTNDGELDPSLSKFIIEDYDGIMEELKELQSILKVDFSNVITNYNNYILNDNDIEEIDEVEEL